MILELPEDAMSIIMTFQAHKDRISLATTCSDLLKAVEAFSERTVENIGANADESFETRIADQSSIVTDMPKPVHLPHRYLLWSALRTHLYTLGDSRRTHVCLGLHTLPAGLISSGGDNMIHLWDLSTKQSVEIFDGSSLVEEHGELLVCGEQVISSFGADIRVFSQGGDPIYTVDAPEGFDYIHSMALSQQKVFFTYVYDEDSIWELDLVTRRVRKRVTWEGGDMADAFDFMVCDNMLIVLYAYVYDDHGERANHRDGIYVFDLDDFSQKHVFHGDYHSIAKAGDASSTVVAARDCHIDVFTLKDGCLLRHLTFSRSAISVQRHYIDILLVYQSRAYVQNGERANKRIQVYNILSGELVRTFDSSAAVIAASTNGRELFFGYNTYTNGGDRGPTIRAFRLQTY